MVNSNSCWLAIITPQLFVPPRGPYFGQKSDKKINYFSILPGRALVARIYLGQMNMGELHYRRLGKLRAYLVPIS